MDSCRVFQPSNYRIHSLFAFIWPPSVHLLDSRCAFTLPFIRGIEPGNELLQFRSRSTCFNTNLGQQVPVAFHHMSFGCHIGCSADGERHRNLVDRLTRISLLRAILALGQNWQNIVACQTSSDCTNAVAEMFACHGGEPSPSSSFKHLVITISPKKSPGIVGSFPGAHWQTGVPGTGVTHVSYAGTVIQFVPSHS